jgi:sugar phosphate isomerase/epimerase
MKTSVFSTSLTALDLEEAIRAAADVGYDAIELGCFAPHLTLETAETHGHEIGTWLRDVGLSVSALSLVRGYTAEDQAEWRAGVDETCRFIRLCGPFGTGIVKLMPGAPGSRDATPQHWGRYRRAMDAIVPVAEAEGVKLAVETHLNTLSDSIDTAARCIDGVNPAVVGVNLDFCNVHTCHESALDAIDRFRGRIYLTHVKDSLFTADSGEYVPMGQGKVGYPRIVERLRAVGYDGYLSVECLYDGAKLHDPRGSVAHDLGVLRRLLQTPSA